MATEPRDSILYKQLPTRYCTHALPEHHRHCNVRASPRTCLVVDVASISLCMLSVCNKFAKRVQRCICSESKHKFGQQESYEQTWVERSKPNHPDRHLQVQPFKHAKTQRVPFQAVILADAMRPLKHAMTVFVIMQGGDIAAMAHPNEQAGLCAVASLMPIEATVSQEQERPGNVHMSR